MQPYSPNVRPDMEPSSADTARAPLKPEEVSPELEREAAAWVSRVATEPSSGNIDAARAWCERSPQHRQAFEKARWLWTAAGNVKTDTVRTDTVRTEPVLSDAVRTEPVLSDAVRTDTVRSDAVRTPARVARSSLRQRAQWAAAASLVLALALGWFLTSTRGDYRNGAAPPRHVELADGSSIVLDANSAVDVHFTPARRDLELLRGNAVFEVVHDTHRPFVVHSQGISATDVGTIYGMSRDPAGASVTVREGEVRVSYKRGASEEVRAGESMRYDAKDGPQMVHGVNAESALAWQHGRLVFDRTPLEEVVAKLNSYRAGYILIANSNLKRLPVSGVFRIDRADDVLTTMEQAFPVRVHRFAGYLIVLN